MSDAHLAQRFLVEARKAAATDACLLRECVLPALAALLERAATGELPQAQWAAELSRLLLREAEQVAAANPDRTAPPTRTMGTLVKALCASMPAAGP